jgi:hypothetical protein
MSIATGAQGAAQHDGDQSCQRDQHGDEEGPHEADVDDDFDLFDCACHWCMLHAWTHSHCLNHTVRHFNIAPMQSHACKVTGSVQTIALPENISKSNFKTVYKWRYLDDSNDQLQFKSGHYLTLFAVGQSACK